MSILETYSDFKARIFLRAELFSLLVNKSHIKFSTHQLPSDIKVAFVKARQRHNIQVLSDLQILWIPSRPDKIYQVLVQEGSSFHLAGTYLTSYDAQKILEEFFVTGYTPEGVHIIEATIDAAWVQINIVNCIQDAAHEKALDELLEIFIQRKVSKSQRYKNINDRFEDLEVE